MIQLFGNYKVHAVGEEDGNWLFGYIIHCRGHAREKEFEELGGGSKLASPFWKRKRDYTVEFTTTKLLTS